jgi:hypothetical protein
MSRWLKSMVVLLILEECRSTALHWFAQCRDPQQPPGR